MRRSAWSAFRREAFHWKMRLVRPRALCLALDMAASDRMSMENREALIQLKRRNLLLHAFDNTAFYKRHYESAGFTRTDLLDPRILRYLPIVTRADVVNHFPSIHARGVPRRFLAPATTGGSTGTPLTVMHDRRFPADAIWWRIAHWWGLHPADDVGMIYRIRRRSTAAITNRILWWPTRKIYLDATQMNDVSMSAFATQLNRLRPALLVGYIGAVYEFAAYIERSGTPIQSPDAVWVTSGPFTEQQRNFMQMVFGAPVYDQYGTCEVMWLAAECRERCGLHMMEDYRTIEFVGDDNQPVPRDDWGRVLVTDLENFGFPLIRYEIGDIGRRLHGLCPCGVTLPRIDKIRGRVSDVIRTPQGGVVSGEYLTTLFDDHPDAVKAFQVYQAANYAITLRCVPGVSPSAKRHIETARNAIHSRVGSTTPVTVELLAALPHDRGKTRFVISDAPPPHSVTHDDGDTAHSR